MDLKTDLHHWYKACQAFDLKDYSLALDTLLVCCPSSKIYFTIGVILVTLHDHQNALNVFDKATSLDPYFSAAYFQSGVCNIMLGDFKQAVKCFDFAYKSLRGNNAINYRQLGLDFTIYCCEVLYNRGVCQIYLENTECGMADLNQAQQLKMNNQHEIIDQATQDINRSTFGIYSIPPTVIYRPTKSQLRLLEGTDSILNTCYSCNAHQLLTLDKHHQHQSYCHLPKYLSKYLHSVINNKSKSGKAPPKSAPSSNMSHHTCSSPVQWSSMSLNPFFRSHSLSYLFPSLHQQRKKQQHINKQQNERCFVDTLETDHYTLEKMETNKKYAHYQQPACNNFGKFKVKLHYEDTRIMMIDANATYQDVLIKIHEKLGLPVNDKNKLDVLKLYCMNNDGVLNQLMDEEGWSLVKWLNRYRDPRQFKSTTKTACYGKIEIWCAS